MECNKFYSRNHNWGKSFEDYVAALRALVANYEFETITYDQGLRGQTWWKATVKQIKNTYVQPLISHSPMQSNWLNRTQ